MPTSSSSNHGSLAGVEATESDSSVDTQVLGGDSDNEICSASADTTIEAESAMGMADLGQIPTAVAQSTVATLMAYPQKSVFFYITDPEEADEALRAIDFGHVGFDTEETQKKAPHTEAGQDVYVEPMMDADGVNWATATVCIIQIAVPGYVYIFDVKRMQLIPKELRRVLGSSAIAKVGSGLINDGKTLQEEAGINVLNLVEVGMMAKYADAEKYADEDAAGISLERCVKDVLGFKLDKSNRATFVWDGEQEASEAQKLFVDAGLDGQASLEVYNRVRVSLRHRELQLGRLVPDDWYTYDYIEGKATRIDRTCRQQKLPWAANLCPWYKRGQFQGYHYQ
ncbi:ribonuclease H-like domain-containing protein [Mycena crocata]|nr:ribonuclease H-like domain-containing protein [Mycena crocata]